MNTLLDTYIILTFLMLVHGGEYCTGDLVWREDAPICVSTCPQRFYYQDCPDRMIGRCVCPDHKPVLRREGDTECVAANSCEPPDWFKLGPTALKDFKFRMEPQSQELVIGRSLTLSCRVNSVKPVQYYWYKLSSLPSGDMTSDDNLYIAGTTKIVISNIKVSDSGFYQCKARSQDGYSLLSKVGQVKVKHTSFDPTHVSSEGVVTNKARAILKCNKASESYPRATISWTKNGNNINDEDIFMNSKEGQDNYGDLYIINVQEKHAGVYKCIATVDDSDVGGVFVLSQITFKIQGSQNQVNTSPIALEEASYGDKVRLGEKATLYCGAYGYPRAEYTWAKATSIQQTSGINGCGEKTCVEENGRKLVVYNVNQMDFGGYFCQVKNSVGLNSLVLNLEEKPQSYDIKFLGISPSQTITPNRYEPFNLTCSVDRASTNDVYIGWYKDGKSVSGSSRIHTEDNVTPHSRIRKLVFLHPTDGDPGLYQCLAYNSEQFVQASTDVVLHRYEEGEGEEGEGGEGIWNPDSPFELKLFTDFVGVHEAHEQCREWKKGAELVSILDNKQNDIVFRLLQENSIDKAWIGLTDESKEGKWQWLTMEDSTRYANWKLNEPDNGGGSGSDYAVMDVAMAGKWEDITNAGTRFPFVCKYYNATCPRIEDSPSFSDFPVKYQKTGKTTFHVFDTAEVTCKSGQSLVVVCGSEGRWEFQEGTGCQPMKLVGRASSIVTNAVLFAATIIFLIIR